MRYEVVRGRVATRSLEVHVTDHCNLRCRQCCSLSPFLPPWFVDPERLRQDLRVARTVLAPKWFKLVGGEPLLHPRLIDCLAIVRAERIAPILSVTTNGLLLHRMPVDFWFLIDHLTLSLYPQPRLTERQLAAIREQAACFRVVVNVKAQDRFEEITLDRPRADDGLTRRVFAGCWLRHRCHMIRDGRFYLCTRPPHFDKFHRGATDYAGGDGVALEPGPNLLGQLRAYLERDEPLAACRECLGGTGARFPHRQLTRLEVATRQEGPP